MKKSVKRNSRKNFTKSRPKKNYVLNIVLIILFILIALFVVKMIFVKSIIKSPFDFFGLGESSEEMILDILPTQDECKTSADCYTNGDTCTKSCSGGKCVNNGKTLCEGGSKCVSSPEDCDCPECNPCTQDCNTVTKQCQSTGNIECTVNGEKTGECGTLATCSGCNPAPNRCQICISGELEDDPNAVKCEGTDYCVPAGQEDTCPDECEDLGCDPCIEYCYTNDDGAKSCARSDKQICPQDGSCRDVKFNCASL